MKKLLLIITALVFLASPVFAKHSNKEIILSTPKAFEEAIKYFESAHINDWEERILYCLYKLKKFDEFKDKLAEPIKQKNYSPFLATLSAHYAQNFRIEDPYNFCPSPLNFVCHEQIPELVDDNQKLIKDLLDDINSAGIGHRKQSRLTAGIQSSGNLFKRKELSFNKLSQALIKTVSEIIILIPSLRKSSRCSDKVNNSVSIVGMIKTIELSIHVFFKKFIYSLLVTLGA